MLVVTKVKRASNFMWRSAVMLLSTKTNIQELLMTHLNVSGSEAKDIARSNKFAFLSIPTEKIIENSKTCKELNVNLKPFKYLGSCLKLNNTILQHRILLLEEMGVKEINVAYVNRKFLMNMRMPVYQFKAMLHIPPEQCISKNMLKHIKEIPLNIGDLKLPNEKSSVLHHYKQCLSLFVSWKLGSEKMKQIDKCINYSSFRMISNGLEALLNDAMLDRDFVKKHIYLINIPAKNIRSVLNTFQDIKIGGMELADVINKWPNILSCDVDNTIKLLESFKKYNIDDDAVRTCLKVFSLRNDVFVERIEKVLNDPDLKMWLSYPRILHLICRTKQINEQLKRLRWTKRIKWANPFTISSPKTYFVRFIESQTSHVQANKFLKQLLSRELEVDEYLINRIMRHPLWKNVPYRNMFETLLFLKAYFCTNDIRQNIHIILYSRRSVVHTLERLYEQYSSCETYDFSTSQYLALCLYTLEKDVHFTGDGVWHEENLGRYSVVKQYAIKHSIIQSSDVDEKLMYNIDTQRDQLIPK